MGPYEKHGRLTTKSELPTSVYAFPKQRKEPGGRLVIPISETLPLSDAAEAQAAAEKGGIGKILLVP